MLLDDCWEDGKSSEPVPPSPVPPSISVSMFSISIWSKASPSSVVMFIVSSSTSKVPTRESTFASARITPVESFSITSLNKFTRRNSVLPMRIFGKKKAPRSRIITINTRKNDLYR